MKNSKQPAEQLEAIYRDRYESTLTTIAESLRQHIAEIFRAAQRVDRVTARAKGIKSFLDKADTRVQPRNRLKYPEPLAEIQDQIGARIVTFYKFDVER